jgi:anthranilate phosphoribosyltransferase
VVAGRATDLAGGAAMARRAIDGGDARAKLDALVAVTRGRA